MVSVDGTRINPTTTNYRRVKNTASYLNDVEAALAAEVDHLCIAGDGRAARCGNMPALQGYEGQTGSDSHRVMVELFVFPTIYNYSIFSFLRAGVGSHCKLLQCYSYITGL
jgi:hypothetical protein